MSRVPQLLPAATERHRTLLIGCTCHKPRPVGVLPDGKQAVRALRAANRVLSGGVSRGLGRPGAAGGTRVAAGGTQVAAMLAAAASELVTPAVSLPSPFSMESILARRTGSTGSQPLNLAPLVRPEVTPGQTGPLEAVSQEDRVDDATGVEPEDAELGESTDGATEGHM